MNSQAEFLTENLKPVQASLPAFSRIRRAPEIIQSALFGMLFGAAIIITVIGVFMSFSQDTEQVERAYNILQFNLILILALAAYLAYRVWRVLFKQRTEQSAPVLHRRFVLIFSLAALVPALIVGAFTTALISQNISGIFGDNVRSNMEQAQAILDDYVNEELEELGEDMTAVKRVLSQSQTSMKSRISYTADLQVLSRLREVDAIYVLGPEGFILSRVETPATPDFQLPNPAVFSGLQPNDVAFQKRTDSNYLIAVTPLDKEAQTYLYLGRILRSKSQVLSSISGIKDATDVIAKFNEEQARMNKIFGLTFVETAGLILMASIWVGLILANRIINPLSGLIHAAERVRAGDMNARVNVQEQWGEVSDLGSAFNRMTQQLNSQREALVREHDLSEQRRQFSEAVLSGVRAGVIGLDQNGKITLMNESARNLLGLHGQAYLGQPISEALAEFAPAFTQARENITGAAEDQVTMEIGEGMKNFDLRVSAYEGARKDTGWVLTFDDMTRLVAAQRHSAWREVARRIAHEIKNPLTPIQLSAERLARKYQNEIKSDPKTFENCTQTIIRQVGSLEQMVNEFSAFARMPSPEFEPLDIHTLIDNVLFEEGVSFPDIQFKLTGELPENYEARGDTRLLTQALTNIYKNAGEAVLRFQDQSGEDLPHGIIETDLQGDSESISITISDNGSGWPLADLDRLLEPYVTTRESGTGLGLAIVKRIAEDHGGSLELLSRPDGERGASVRLSIPAILNIKAEPAKETS